MSKASFCVNCGKKYYPNSYQSYPSSNAVWVSDRWQWTEIDNQNKRFHSQSCMHSWLVKNAQSFSRLVDEVEYIKNNNNNNRERA
jgi:hypothetical protein